MFLPEFRFSHRFSGRKRCLSFLNLGADSNEKWGESVFWYE